MLNLAELEQLVAFAELGTLSKVAERLHISQPTLTRTMRHIEDAFGVPLFHRGKNRIELNETGKLAADYAQRLLAEAEKATQAVRAFDRGLKTITIHSCAPAPLWSLLPALAQRYPERTISSKIMGIGQIVRDVSSAQCDVGILPCSCPDGALADTPYIQEKLSVCVPRDHDLSRKQNVTFEELNGFNCLLRDQIGFWTDLCRRRMPASRFLIQTDEFEFQELVRTSSLFCFSTDLANPQNRIPSDRVALPITDPEANVTYHIICHLHKRELIQNIRALAVRLQTVGEVGDRGALRETAVTIE